MPYTRRARRPAYRRRWKRKPPAGLSTRPRMAPRSVLRRRKYGVDVRTFLFKNANVINCNTTPNQFVQWKTSDLYTLNIPSFNNCLEMYDQYKILGFMVRFFPADVGTEALARAGLQPPGTAPTLQRGDQLLWLDQRIDPGAQVPQFITEVINTSSARMINPRRPYRISIWRPRGKPNWGSTTDIATIADPWNASINMLINNATSVPTTQPELPIWYYTIQWKVVFRGRKQD